MFSNKLKIMIFRYIFGIVGVRITAKKLTLYHCYGVITASIKWTGSESIFLEKFV